MTNANFNHSLDRPSASEEGFVIILVTVLITTILAYLALMFNIANYTLISSQVRIAADAAAHAGASNICSRDACWEKSRMAAIEVLRRSEIRNNLGQPSDIQIASMATGPIYIYDNLTISIERGFWAAGTSGPGTFQSLEIPAAHPGVPQKAAFNAIRVRIVRTSIDPILNLFLPASAGWSGSAEAVASAAEIKVVDSAPFALPLCSLIDSGGTFNPGAVCSADRLFAQSARYCAQGDPGCGVIPAFHYDPVSNDWRTLDHCPAPAAPFNPAHCDLKYDINCAFNSPRFSSASDHFGVIGLPGSDPVTEHDVADIIRANNGTRSAAIGEPFTILPDGLTDSNSYDAMYYQMFTNGFGDADHPRFSDTPLTSLELNISYSYQPQFGSGPMIAPLFTCPGNPIDQPNNGVCNSVRRDFSFQQTMQTFGYFHFSPMLAAATATDVDKNAAAVAEPVWHTSIPVIADFGPNGVECEGVNGKTTDPEIVTGSGHQWLIIGFMPADMFDFDIDHAPPTTLDVNGSGSLSAGPYQIGFNKGNCNAVRGRLRCAGDLVPTSDPSAPRRVVFVK